MISHENIGLNIIRSAGADTPELKEIHVGYMPLTDCASLVIASVMKLDEKYGIKLVLSKEKSWANVRDKLLNGSLHAAHALYGLIYGVHMGIGGQRTDMSVLMTLNHNGQGITLSNHLRDLGVTNGAALKAWLTTAARPATFAHTFPTGTHAMWLYYWLAYYGIHPLNDVNIITVPPAQMVMQMRMSHLDGFCVGEPWNSHAIYEQTGFSVASSQDIWPDHPEKVLGCTADFVQRYPNAARALIKATLDASRYLDEMSNRHRVAALIADKTFLDCPVEIVDARMEGRYQDGLGQHWMDGHFMQFHQNGRVNFPYLSDGMWFLTQFKRWGLLKQDPDYLAIAQQINQITLYQQAASCLDVPIPSSDMRASTFIDGSVWNGSWPKEYANSFEIMS